MLLKTGTNKLGSLSISNSSELVPLITRVLLNPFIIIGMVIFASGFFIWIMLLSWFELGVIFPLTAMTYIFVAWMSFFALGETLGLVNYFGMLLISLGIYLLLQR